MTATPTGVTAPFAAGELVHLESRLPLLGRRELGEELQPLLASLQVLVPAGERGALCDAALSICRRIYANARSIDALPLARAVLAQATLANDQVLMRRASTACGLLLADSADIAGALEQHVQSLRLASAAGDAIEMSRTWNNIGLALSVSGNHDMARRCYLRALALVQEDDGPVYSRYAACANLANSLCALGETGEGLEYANRALEELIPAYVEQDSYGVMILHRNLVLLLVSSRRVEEAEPHVAVVATLATQVKTPRAFITAATTRAAYEIAVGRSDLALTRLDGALSKARETPGILQDTLACVIRAEEAVGNAEGALVRMQELSDHLHGYAVKRAREHIEIAAVATMADAGCNQQWEQQRARLTARIAPPAQPEGWETLRRLAISAALRMDKTGWHGMRVGALTKGLALAWGSPPLEALRYGLAAELHDIGMTSVPESILAKSGLLTDGELAVARRHVEAGSEILRDNHHPQMLAAQDVARYHHAWWDGNGYPARVGGRFIPLPARMCALADAYDAMVCGLSGHAPVTMDAALEEINRASGTQFDPDLARCFDAFIRRETEERGVDRSSSPGMEGFQELIRSLQEDRGFI